MGKNLDPDVKLITIEILASKAETAKKNTKKAEIPRNVELLVGDAKEAIPRLKGTFDLVFLDATKTKYMAYLKLVEDKLHKGSVIVADKAEISQSQMSDCLNHVRFSCKYKIRDVAVGNDGLEISVKT